MAETVHIKAKLLWRWGRTRSGRYVAICDDLGQIVQAEKFTSLLATITEAVESTFRDLLSTGDLATFLREHGWKPEGITPLRTTRNVRFDVPFELKGSSRRDLEKALC